MQNLTTGCNTAESSSPQPDLQVTGKRQSSAAYIPALDGVRGVAILLVLTCHWVQSIFSLPIHGYLSAAAIPMAFIGHTGVDLFFVLSGFLITRILLGARSNPSGIKNFLIRRALRIFPLYYLVLFIVLVLVPADIRHHQLRMNPNDTGLVWLWVYGSNFADIFHHDWLYGALDHFWSLSVEEHFYWIWPIVVIFSGRKTLIGMCGGLLAISLLSRAYYCYIAHDGVAPDIITFCRLDGFAFGGLLALAEASKFLHRKNLTPWLCALFAAGIGCSYFEHQGGFGAYGCVILATVEAAAFGAVVGLVIIHKDGWLGRLFSNPVLTFFGVYSYGIYVFEHILRPPLVPVTLFYGADKPNNAAISYGVFHLVISIAIAFASYHLYEKHFLKLKLLFPAWLSGLNGPDAAVSSKIEHPAVKESSGAVGKELAEPVGAGATLANKP